MKSLDLLVVRGRVQAIKVRLAGSPSPSQVSRLDEALAAAVHRLMPAFAEKWAVRLTGHLSVRVLVDEEFDDSSIRHTSALLTVYLALRLPRVFCVMRVARLQAISPCCPRSQASPPYGTLHLRCRLTNAASQ